MRPGDLRREAMEWPHPDAAQAPGDLRRAFWWDRCPHGWRPGVPADPCCPDCEVDRQTDRALAWGITGATWAAAVLVCITWAVARVLGEVRR